MVSQRLDRLDRATATALETAAIAGPQFELATLRRATDLPERDLLNAVDEAERAGLIGQARAGGLAYRFSHELVRLAVIARLTALRRAEIHLRVAETLVEHDPGGDRAGRLAALAHHFAAAAPVGGAGRAVEYGLRAARAASSSLDFDEAAEQLRTALAFGIDDPREAAGAYLELGYASHRAGKALDSLNAFGETAQLARDMDDAELLARAAIGFEEACWRPGMHDAVSVGLLEEASAALGTEDSELRTRVLAGLARAQFLHGQPVEAGLAAEEAIAMARRRGDRRGVAQTLVGAWSHSDSATEEINAMLTEALEIGEELGDFDLRTEALGWLVPSYVALCDHRRARRCLALLLHAARQQNQPFHLHVAEHYSSALALCDGELAEAEAAATRSYEWSRLLAGRDASGAYGIQMFNVRREQGRLAELAPVIRLLADRPSGAWRPGLAALLAEVGMGPEAQTELRRTVPAELDRQRHMHWPATLTYLTARRDAARGRTGGRAPLPRAPPAPGEQRDDRPSRRLLRRHRPLSRDARRVLGEWDRAERHFADATALNQRLGAHTWLAHTLSEHARALIRHGRPEDRERAEALIAQALVLAERYELTRVRSRTSELGAAPTADTGDGLSARENDVLRLVARGLSNREIGQELFISEHTTASHIRSILRKTGCANRTEAATYAQRRGLLD